MGIGLEGTVSKCAPEGVRRGGSHSFTRFFGLPSNKRYFTWSCIARTLSLTARGVISGVRLPSRTVGTDHLPRFVGVRVGWTNLARHGRGIQEVPRLTNCW